MDAEGRLVGINTMMTGSDTGLAVPVHAVRAFLVDERRGVRNQWRQPGLEPAIALSLRFRRTEWREWGGGAHRIFDTLAYPSMPRAK